MAARLAAAPVATATPRLRVRHRPARATSTSPGHTLRLGPTPRGRSTPGCASGPSRCTPPARTAAARRASRTGGCRSRCRARRRTPSPRGRGRRHAAGGEVVAVVGVTGERGDGAVGLHPVAVGLHRVVHGVGRDGERADGERHGIRRRRRSRTVPPSRPARARGTSSPVAPRCRPARGRAAAGARGAGTVLTADVEAAEVDAVVGVQVAHEHRVEVLRREVALQGAQRAASEVDQEVPQRPRPRPARGRTRRASRGRRTSRSTRRR